MADAPVAFERCAAAVPTTIFGYCDVTCKDALVRCVDARVRALETAAAVTGRCDDACRARIADAVVDRLRAGGALTADLGAAGADRLAAGPDAAASAREGLAANHALVGGLAHDVAAPEVAAGGARTGTQAPAVAVDAALDPTLMRAHAAADQFRETVLAIGRSNIMRWPHTVAQCSSLNASQCGEAARACRLIDPEKRIRLRTSNECEMRPTRALERYRVERNAAMQAIDAVEDEAQRRALFQDTLGRLPPLHRLGFEM